MFLFVLNKKASPEEKELLAKALQCDLKAVESVSHLYGVSLYRFLTGVLGDQEERVRKIMSQSLSLAIREIPLLEKEIPFALRVMRLLARRLRKDRALGMFRPGDHSSGKEPRLRILEESWRRISREERIVILLRDQIFFLYDEIAFIFETSPDAIKKLLKQARDSFRQAMKAVMTQRKTSRK
ncbi:MAG: hypothetical protein JW893_03930 [Candidatus Omnitrophica bacterium]|nr:hypothetical protein [Candidatus Omnitrophota bacterium]